VAFLTRRVAVIKLKRTPQIFSGGSRNFTVQRKTISCDLAGVVTPPTFLRYRDGGRFF